jgi:hypothetical protein
VCPRPVAHRRADPRAHRVLDDVAAGGVEVVLAVDRAGGEAVGEQVAEAPVALVELLGVAAEEPLQTARELRLGAVEDQVIVRRHETERVQLPAEALDAGLQEDEEPAPVVVVAEDRAAVDAARHDVEVAVRKRGPRHASHASIKAPIPRLRGTCG